MSSSPGFDFSFAGLKTAVLYHLKKNTREKQEDVAASFLASVVDVLTKKSLEATRRYHLKRLVVVGGVAANSHLRERLTSDGKERGIDVLFPERSYCTDNAAMIATAGTALPRENCIPGPRFPHEEQCLPELLREQS